MICGGHSLGGPLTAAFASWDFDGDPNTTRDAGYKQCAGLSAWTPRSRFTAARGARRWAGWRGRRAARRRLCERPAADAETIEVPDVFGVGAYYEPKATDLLRRAPAHEQHRPLPAGAVLARRRPLRERRPRHPRVPPHRPGGAGRDLRRQLGTAVLSALERRPARGRPLVDKNFPTPGGGFLALPEDPATPLYAWEGYRQVGAPGHPLGLNDEGQPYTSREGEVSDLRQLARTLFEGPADFTEQYFPTRLLADVSAAGTGTFPQLRYDGPSLRPELLVQAGDSDDNSAPDEGGPIVGQPPNAFAKSRQVTLPGYNHLDVATAVWHQNDGRPEPASKALANFVLSVAR